MPKLILPYKNIFKKAANPDQLVLDQKHWLPNGRKQFLVLAANVLQEGFLELCDFAGFQLVQVSPHTSIDDRDLLLNGHGH